MNQTRELIQVARRALGMTQADLVAVTGMKQGTLSRYESGDREPDSDAVAILAEALGLTTDALAVGSAVTAPLAVDAHMRRRVTTKVSDWRRSEAQLNMFRFQADRLFSTIEMTPELIVPATDPDQVEPADAARLVRQQWRMPIGPVKDLTRWVEAAGVVVVLRQLATPRIDGLSQWVGTVPVVLLNSAAPMDRRRLTLAHELGHLVMHAEYAQVDMEAQANEFAAEFLMPEAAIRPQLRNIDINSLGPLKQLWGVSMQAIIERAFRLRIMTKQTRTGLYRRFGARGWRRHEPGSDTIPEEKPALLDSLMQQLQAINAAPEAITRITGVTTDSPNQLLPIRPPGLRLL